ncbi:MAG: hypothetical protein AMXMBFR23_23700 [Chloroflexota bacterium]
MLGLTAALLLAGAEAWRPVFALAHLAALVALIPLGVALVRHAARAAREADAGPVVPALIQRHPQVAFLLAAATVAVVVSLMNFEDGIRWLRRVANFTTVGIILVLVARYLRWARHPSMPGATPARTPARGATRPRNGARRR